MKRTIQSFLVAGSLVIGGAALAQGSAQGEAARDANAKGGKAMAKGGMVEHRGFMVPADEKSFLERMHYTNQLEIKLAQLAQKNSNNPDVKSFADAMQKEHTGMDEKLMAYAKTKGLKLADMPKPANDMEKKAMAADKAKMEELQALKAEPFDSCYMAGQVGDHDMTLGKLMAGQKAFTEGEAATLVNEAAQSVAKHRGHAYTVLGKLGQSMAAGMGGAGTMGGGSHQGTMGGQHGAGGATGTGTTGGQYGTGNATGTGTTGGATGTGGTTGTGTGTKGGGTK